MLWEIDLRPRKGLPDRDAEGVAADAKALGLAKDVQVATARGYLVQGDLTADRIERLAHELFGDPVVEEIAWAPVGAPELSTPPTDWSLKRPVHTASASSGVAPTLLQVLLKPGVMDPVAQSAEEAVADFGFRADAIRTLRKYWIAGATDEELRAISGELLANDAIEQVIEGPLPFDRLQTGGEYRFELRTVAIRDLDDAGLMRLSKEGQLYLQLAEMQTIRSEFAELDREPTDSELETIAQTWSEHCSHKTLAGRIAYQDEHGERQFQNMLKETIFAATQELRQRWGDDDW